MSKKDIVNMIVETYSAHSKADQDFLDLHAPIITTHYSPDYPEMDDILTARHFNTYVRREHGRNHPVAGEAFSKANQTRQAMYNQDHGYMPDEDSNYSFPHPHSLGEGARWNAFKKRASSDFGKLRSDYKAASARDKEAHSAKLLKHGKISADKHWENTRHGTYHAADGNHYDYKRTVVDGQHQLQIRKQGSKSNSHETVHINKDWSSEQGMRHHKGPSHIEHLYSSPENKPKVDMNEMIMLRPHPYPELIDNFPHINPFSNKRKKPSLKTPFLPDDVRNAVKAVAHHLKTDARIVAETMVDRPNTGNDFPMQGSSKQKPKDNSGKVWKPKVTDTTTKPPTSTLKPMTEERFVIKYVLKGTLEEGETKPWSDPDKAVAYAHKMFASQLYEEVEVIEESVWRHVHAVTGAAKGFTTGLGKGIIGGGLAGAAIGLTTANPVGGAIGGAALGGIIGSSQDATKGFMKGYDKGREMDFHNAKKKYENSRDTYGKDHPVTLKHLDHMRKLSG
jgi:hypothetical protein